MANAVVKPDTMKLVHENLSQMFASATVFERENIVTQLSKLGNALTLQLIDTGMDDELFVALLNKCKTDSYTFDVKYLMHRYLLNATVLDANKINALLRSPMPMWIAYAFKGEYVDGCLVLTERRHFCEEHEDMCHCSWECFKNLPKDAYMSFARVVLEVVRGAPHIALEKGPRRIFVRNFREMIPFEFNDDVSALLAEFGMLQE